MTRIVAVYFMRQMIDGDFKPPAYTMMSFLQHEALPQKAQPTITPRLVLISFSKVPEDSESTERFSCRPIRSPYAKRYFHLRRRNIIGILYKQLIARRRR